MVMTVESQTYYGISESGYAFLNRFWLCDLYNLIVFSSDSGDN